MPRGVLSQGSRLVIDNARPTHAGTYTCRVNTNLTSQVILLVTGLVPYFGQVSSISSPSTCLDFNMLSNKSWSKIYGKNVI